jgi:hypothetical protein
LSESWVHGMHATDHRSRAQLANTPTDAFDGRGILPKSTNVQQSLGDYLCVSTDTALYYCCMPPKHLIYLCTLKVRNDKITHSHLHNYTTLRWYYYAAEEYSSKACSVRVLLAAEHHQLASAETYNHTDLRRLLIPHLTHAS